MPTISYSVHSLDHFSLIVPDLKQAFHFFDSFGLRVEQQHDCLGLYAADGHQWARVRAGSSKSLEYLSFNCDQAAFAPLSEQVKACNATILDHGENFIWFKDPDGNLLQIKVGLKTIPDPSSACMAAKPTSIQGSAQVRSVGTRDQLPRIQPVRLSHVLNFTPDVDRSIEFYSAALGLKLSDKSEDIIAFMHAPFGCDHHLIAFAKSTAKGWHHCAWEVPSVDDVGIGAFQMAQAGYTDGWGTGRHSLGSNYFHYVRDPWGSFCEYSAEMDFIAEGVTWPSGDFAPENSLYLWGPDVPDYFIFNTEA